MKHYYEIYVSGHYESRQMADCPLNALRQHLRDWNIKYGFIDLMERYIERVSFIVKRKRYNSEYAVYDDNGYIVQSYRVRRVDELEVIEE